MFLKTDFEELKWLEFLPDVLGRYHLLYSRMALLYALGYENVLRSEAAIPENETEEDVRKIFVDLRNQPASADLPERPELSQKSIAQLKSFVAGCEVTVDAANNLQSVQLGEIILAALESLLATNLYSELLPHASRLTIHVQPDGPSDEWPIYDTHQRDLFPSIQLGHSSHLTEQIRNDQVGFRGWLEKFIIEAMLQIVFVPDVMSWALRLVRGEGVLDRALNFSETIIPVQGILGEQPKFRLSDWKSEGTSNRFQLQRTAPWDQGMESLRTLAVNQSSMPQPEVGEIPAEPLDINKLKHKDRRVYSLVNFPLWDQAGWRGISYMIAEDVNWEPGLAFNFEDPEAAKLIFTGWLDELGQTDQNEALRISIITGIDSDNPFSYTVVIGVNPQITRNDTSTSSYVLISRWLRMDPLNSHGLDAFRERYDQMKKYILLPAQYEDPPKQPTPFFDLGINKSEIRIVPAWQLSENDPDVIAIVDDLNPIIPDGIENAPVLKAITTFKRRKEQADAEEDRLSKLLELLGQGAEELASDRKALQKIFKYLSKGQIKGDWSCYCGSGKKLRQCHLNELDELRRKIDVATAKSLLKKITLMERTTTN